MKNKLKEELNARLSGLKMGEDLKRRVFDQIRKEEEPIMKQKISLSAIIVIALIAVAAVAFALTDGFGLFDLMGRGKREEFSIVQKEAYDLVQKNLVTARFDHVDVTVTEAVYDGKYLRVVHSTKERDAKAPFDDAKVYSGGFSFEAAEKDGVWWNSLDWAIVNGEGVNPLGEAGVHAGKQNGETLAWIQYDLSELEVGDELTVVLPIRGKESIDNKELSFTMSVKDLTGVRRIQAIPDVRFSDYSLHLAEMLISPIRVYAKVEMTADAGVTAERCDEIMWKWAMDGVLKDEGDDKPFTSSGGGSSGYLENGEYAGDFKIKIIDETKPTRFMVEFEFLTRESYPDTFILTNGADSLSIPNREEMK
ncbi:MAG: hypothetical protein GX858_01110 [Clostridiales bacterium]|nr:hypothetical protein [Clostridiales bacterium]